MATAVIVDIIRTPSGKGKPGGALSDVHPAALLAQTLSALVERNGLDTAGVDDVIAGCVGQIGDQSLNIARTALLTAGFPESVPGTTVDRQCGSSQQAAHFAAQGVIAGAYDIVIACGVESMSRVPIGTSRAGRNPTAPLADRYPEGLANQGIGAELIAARWKLDRESLDAYSAQSHARAAQAAASGAFDNEIIGVKRPDGSVHTKDETVRPGTTAEGLSGLKPAYYTEAYAERFPEITWQVSAGSS
jgi:acetyl-CoA acyltransferase